MTFTLHTTISIQDTECNAEIEYSWHEGSYIDHVEPYATIDKITAWFPHKARVFNAKQRCHEVKTTPIQLDMLSPEYSFLIDDEYMKDLQLECRIHHNEHDKALRAEYMAQICRAK